MDVSKKTSNEKRLIDANALQRKICGAKCGCEYEDCGNEGDCAFDHFIFHAPTIEVEPVRHGVWVIEKRHSVSRNPYMDDNYFASATCSECDFCIHAETKSFGYPDLNTANYCPNCGAKMDGDSHD